MMTAANQAAPLSIHSVAMRTDCLVPIHLRLSVFKALSPLGGISALPLLDLHDSRGRPDDKMTEEMVATVPLAPSHEAAPNVTISMDELEDEDKLERLRTAVVVKTYSKLMRLYGIKASPENEERMLRRVRAFSKALFKNMAWNGRQTR